MLQGLRSSGVANVLWAVMAVGSMFASAAAVAEPRVLSLDEYRASDTPSRLMYLDFWASWCSPCRQSFPWMNEIQEKYAAEGLRVVAINLDTEAEAAERFLRQVPATFDVVLDPTAEMAKQFEVPAMPTSYLIGMDGTILDRHEGFRVADKADLEASIKLALTRGNRVHPKETD